MDALDVALVAGGEAQVIEVEVKRGSRLAGQALRKIDFPKSSLVGAVVRGDTTLLPRGDDTIEAGDRLIIFALTEAVPRLEKLFRESGK